ncbi:MULTISPECIES: phosphate ABC transporter permease subunit PstC [unclassified Lentimonas]|uniref:phosphate ABC transporter permease subunit PstC n=1 Tax=unclassified Lentimonas TaxID=2630993 RepID=UPI00132C5773|nr:MULTISPECIES: phosphate ABC transporter permease subunit PstC [unclassified Lentimonas]CAA6691645.1 Phosphate transport system permease protein PstC (TC 3.A.1.7.1) [Lentimonas sp. CC10]CAA6696295.1 Phosphate transport system permease protein PstC (TC 3.A.1.7.1) [Lentimonas sp. CC19]CAA7070830.1 Phosphate transport system permease protein PstC (TC 3.A.1.7.1) [Lentimonas sp. CC11]
MASPTQNNKNSPPAFSKRRALFMGKDSDSIIKTFFGSNAMVAILVLALITIFLFKEGAGFVGLYHKSLQEYRQSGLEYVDILKESRDDYTELNRYLNDIKTEWINDLKADGLSQSEISKKVFSPEAKALFMGYIRAGSNLRSFVKQKMDIAIEVRDQNTTNQNLNDTLKNYSTRISNIKDAAYSLKAEDIAKFSHLLRESGRTERAEGLSDTAPLSQDDRTLYLELLDAEYRTLAQSITPVDYESAIAEVTGDQEKYTEILNELDVKIQELLASADAIDFNSAALDKRIETFTELNALYISQVPSHLNKLASWNPHEPISNSRALGAFLTGKNWVTASDQQDWYGLLPLITGSLLISSIALFFAVPFGVGAAIYVNQIAGPTERNFIKPYIEFISAIPSVVIGFFGVVVFGEAIRLLSQVDALSWVPFFPVQERLNAFTAGCLLALMAIPTIFTLAEDAINNVPRHFKEASFAMGATRLQTTMRVIVPTALSGIISAIMLGFGRVIGETMVVLLCAGNRIKIPDFTSGPGVFFEPVHTMTGIIAQEMGEVVHGSLHYRALFMVGIVLFFASLLINYGAQWIVKKYSKLES